MTDRMTRNRHRGLHLIMRCDQAGSAAFIVIALITGPALAIFGPHGWVLGLIWTAVSLFGLWLGLLGIGMAYGLTRTMLRGEELPDEFFAELMLYESR